MPGWYHWQGTDLILHLHVQPRARCNEIVGVHGGRLKLRTTAPPVDGKANEYLCAYLADLCGVSKSKVTLVSGQGSSIKRLRLQLTDRQLPPELARFDNSVAKSGKN